MRFIAAQPLLYLLRLNPPPPLLLVAALDATGKRNGEEIYAKKDIRPINKGARVTDRCVPSNLVNRLLRNTHHRNAGHALRPHLQHVSVVQLQRQSIV